MDKIKIITTALTPTITPIRGGGEEQSLVSNAVQKVSSSLEVNSQSITEQITKTIAIVNSAIDKLDEVSKKFPVEEITLSLAISADGDIGLVSAGAEATIEIKFKRSV